MEPTRLRCVVVVRDGPSRRVGAGGLLIGRQGDCDIVTNDPSVSRRHALVRLTSDGAEVVPLGRAPIYADEVQLGEPPPRARLPAGNHAIRAVLADGREQTFSIEVIAGEDVSSEKLAW
jgi:hypothetical protein